MPPVPPIPAELWDQIPPAAQAAILALVQQYEQRLQALQQQVDQLTQRLNQNSTNSSRPPSSDPPHVKRRPPKPASGRKRGRAARSRTPATPLGATRAGQADHPVEAAWPAGSAAMPYTAKTRSPGRHQVAEIPPVEPEVTEYRLHRLTCPDCGTRTCASLPAGRADRGFRPSAASRAGCPGRRLPPGQASDPAVGPGPLRPIDLDGDGRQAGAVHRRRPGNSRWPNWKGISARSMPTSTRPPGGRPGRRAWLWVVVTPLVTVFHIAATRCGKVARATAWLSLSAGGHVGSLEGVQRVPPPPALLVASASGLSGDDRSAEQRDGHREETPRACPTGCSPGGIEFETGH